MSLLNISNLHQPLKLFYDSDASNYIKIQSPNNLTSNYTLTLPENHGIANQILKIDSSQKLYWDSVGLSISNIPNSVVEGDLTIGDDNNNILIIESKLNIPLGETGQVLTKQSNGLIEFNDRLYPDYQFYFIKGKSQSFTIQTGTHSFISSQTKWQWDKDTSSSIKSSSPSLLTWNSDTEFRFNKRQLKKFISVRVNRDGINLQFSRGALNDKVRFSNENEDIIIIESSAFATALRNEIND